MGSGRRCVWGACVHVCVCDNKSPCTEINIGEVRREFNERLHKGNLLCERRPQVVWTV